MTRAGAFSCCVVVWLARACYSGGSVRDSFDVSVPRILIVVVFVSIIMVSVLMIFVVAVASSLITRNILTLDNSCSKRIDFLSKANLVLIEIKQKGKAL